MFPVEHRYGGITSILVRTLRLEESAGVIQSRRRKIDGEPGTKVHRQDGPTQISQNGHSGGWSHSTSRRSICWWHKDPRRHKFRGG